MVSPRSLFPTVCSVISLLLLSWIDRYEGLLSTPHTSHVNSKFNSHIKSHFKSPIVSRYSKLLAATADEIITAKKTVKVPRAVKPSAAVLDDTVSEMKPVKPVKEVKEVKAPRVVKPKYYTSTSTEDAVAEISVDLNDDTDHLIADAQVQEKKKASKSKSPLKVAVASEVTVGEASVVALVTEVAAVGADIRSNSADSLQRVESVINKPLVLTVYGEPTPLSRHMVSRGHMYNPSAGAQKEFAAACISLLPANPLTGPLEATLYFYFSRPKNHYGTGKNAHVLKPLTASNWHSKRKDLDNLVKFVLDALNAKAYEDDSQIAVIRSAKFYTEGEPYTRVVIRSLSEKDFDDFIYD